MRNRWIGHAACAWAVLFGAPHLWWALGIPAGFPGGEASYHRFMSSTWRYAYGVAGMVVDGASDPVWWPAFLIGGILFGSLAWLTRAPRPVKT